jgi:hypothetical protein
VHERMKIRGVRVRVGGRGNGLSGAHSELCIFYPSYFLWLNLSSRKQHYNFGQLNFDKKLKYYFFISSKI